MIAFYRIIRFLNEEFFIALFGSLLTDGARQRDGGREKRGGTLYEGLISRMIDMLTGKGLKSLSLSQ